VDILAANSLIDSRRSYTESSEQEHYTAN